MADFSKNATVAKARAMYGKRLKEADYRELSLKKSVAETAEYLKKHTHYSSSLAGVDTVSIHRGFLEQVLRRHHFEEYLRICRFQSLDKQPFYNYMIVWSEIREIMRVILHINAGSNEDYIAYLPSYLMEKASFSLIELAKCRSFKDILSVLKGTDYFSVLKDIPPLENGSINVTLCEVRLRSSYLKNQLAQVKKHFKGKSADVLKSQIEMQTDLINIINAYRMKVYFGAGGETIRQNMLDISCHISKSKMAQLYNCSGEDEFIKIFSSTIYGRQLSLSEGEDFEMSVQKLRSISAKRSLMFSQDAGVSIYSLQFLLETELENIIKIVEGIRYARSPEYIQSQLIIV